MGFAGVLFSLLYIAPASLETRKTFTLEIESTQTKTQGSVTGRVGSWTPVIFLNLAVLKRNQSKEIKKPTSAKLPSPRNLTAPKHHTKYPEKGFKLPMRQISYYQLLTNTKRSKKGIEGTVTVPDSRATSFFCTEAVVRRLVSKTLEYPRELLMLK